MKCLSKLTLIAFVLLAALALAQNGPFQHIIIIVQENRTPDNLFGAGAPNQVGQCGSQDDFELGVDIVNDGKVKGWTHPICNVSLPMNLGNIDFPHGYNDGWVPQYDGGAMDGFCQVTGGSNGCLQYSYVQSSDVKPYFDIAINYGFANYFFQTNQGPSFPAHQFLFSGTSAPVAPGVSNYLDFVAENGPGKQFHDSGCPMPASLAAWVDPSGKQIGSYAECYPHDTLVTGAAYCVGTQNCDKGFSWRYYTPEPSVIWTAPGAFPQTCYGQATNVGGACGQDGSYGSEWSSHIALPTASDSAPIFNDIQNCKLPQITYVIPDEVWSDHPAFDGTQSPPYGPSWVGDIVDAVGNSWTSSGNNCDYWGYPSHGAKSEPTAIFVVWDDWGGFYDHVPPWAYYRGTWDPIKKEWDCAAPDGWGCGYVSGFRVPLLVVSEYTTPGYISGKCGVSGYPACGSSQNQPNQYVHDFGSILAYIEWNFGFNPRFIAKPYYADYNAPDWDPNRQIAPLSDFFNTNNQYTFTSISTPFPAGFFQNYYQTQLPGGGYPVPTGPDGDDSD